MKISYKWLQSYFEKSLPEPDKLAELLTFSFAEVENVTQTDADATRTNADTVFDIKILPDRACYALSHRGVAYEVAAITSFPKKEISWPQPQVTKVKPLEVRVEALDLCSRYMARVIENVTQKELSWVKEHLEAVWQRSINPIVDGANIVMFDRGQPLHAFDADKVKGAIIVRRARKGEKITTLDNREVLLDESILLIADEAGPLALAGIKGGKRAEVTASTRNLILESANFNASYIRKASERLGIKTEASKRFENRFSPALASKGLADFSAYLFEMDKNLKAGEVVDWYPNLAQEKKITIRPEYIEHNLGIKLTPDSIGRVLERLLIKVEKKGGEWTLTPPVWRADLAITEDIVEEVGRLYGYDKIPAMLLPKSIGTLVIPKEFYYEWKIREALVNLGFSEVMTSSFSEKGEVTIEKPLAEDKKYARPNLRGGFAAALRANTLNTPLFGSDEGRIFEIGRVFPEDGEHAALALGYAGPKKKVIAELTAVVKLISEKFGVALAGETKDGVFECNLDSAFAILSEPKDWDISIPETKAKAFTPFSLYPFIVRDIALFVPAGTQTEKVHQLILKEAGKSVVRSWLFDRFEKDGKISYAFRLVFQSFERTLTDDEVNKIMEKVTAAVSAMGWQVR